MKNKKYSLRVHLLNEGWFDTDDFPDLQGRDQAEIDREMKIKLGEKPVETWQDLRDLITMYTKQEEFLKKARNEGELAGKIGKAIISFLPYPNFAAGMGAVKDAVDLASQLNDMSQEDIPVQKLPLFDALQLDTQYADIIEYGLQDDMVADFMDDISDFKGKIVDNPHEWENMNDYAEYWLADRRDTGGSHETVIGADQGVKFTDLTIPDLRGSGFKDFFAGFGTLLSELW